MFEHMRNYESLLSKIAGWLTVDGKLFVHIFCHKQLAYPFETEGEDNWMGRYFFTGIPFTEQQALRSRGEDYRLYQKTTSMFFPWWPET